MAMISHRKYIRWLPGEASEPTSTLVLTSPQNRFVDLRVLVSDDDAPFQDTCLALDRLDWAIAGMTSSEERTCHETGEAIRHSTFHHWIDSRIVNPVNVADEGDMYPQEDGTTLEKGTMVNPETGVDTAYEESWLDVEPDKVEGWGVSSAVVALRRGDDGAVCGLMVCVGEHCQGFRRDGDDVLLERWQWKKSGWKRLIQMGAGRGLPSERLLSGEGETKMLETVRVGDKVVDGQDVWEVVEWNGWSK